VRLLPIPVEDAGDKPVAANAPRIRGAAPFALAHLEPDPFTCHSGGQV
jgi:hypothetical protein